MRETGERTTPDTGEIPVVQKQDGNYSADPNDPEVARAIHQEQLDQKKQARTKRFHGRVAAVITAVVVLVALCGGAWGAYAWSQNQYYLAADEGKVAIYQGVPTNIFGLQLSHPIERTSMHISELPEQWRNQLKQGIPADSYSDAQAHVDLIEDQFNQMQQGRKPRRRRPKRSASALRNRPRRASPRRAPAKQEGFAGGFVMAKVQIRYLLQILFAIVIAALGFFQMFARASTAACRQCARDDDRHGGHVHHHDGRSSPGSAVCEPVDHGVRVHAHRAGHPH